MNTKHFFLTALASLALGACHIKGITGNGHMVTQDRDVQGFNSVEVTNGLRAEISQGNATSVTVHADDNLQPHIVTSVSGNTLTISTDGNNWLESDGLKVIVVMKDVQNISVSGGSAVNTSGVLRSGQINVKTSSGSDGALNLEADHITAQASSGSHLTLDGKALSLDINSSSGSAIDAENLTANEVNAQSSSGSSIHTNAVVALAAKASSGSSVTYKGHPKVVREESSGGSVSPR